MLKREIVGYVLGGPTPADDYEVATLDEAMAAYDSENEDNDSWAVGVKYADGSVSFDCPWWHIVGYVVSGPTGAYDYEVETLDEAFAAYDSETEDADGWAIGARYADGSVSFDCVLRRQLRAA